MDLLTNPWVISFLAMGFMVSNIMALRWVSKLKIGQPKPKKEQMKKDDSQEDVEPKETNANLNTDTDKK